jgi:signal transduction histidine kinase
VIVSVEVVHEGVGEEEGEAVDWVEISVQDSGIGIPPEKLREVFEEFYQADGSATRAHGGTGLGLSISKRLVEMMHGEITVESEVGEGSIFTVRLPRERPRAARPNILPFLDRRDS